MCGSKQSLGGFRATDVRGLNDSTLNAHREELESLTPNATKWPPSLSLQSRSSELRYCMVTSISCLKPKDSATGRARKIVCRNSRDRNADRKCKQDPKM